jgi:hypothetical protein
VPTRLDTERQEPPAPTTPESVPARTLPVVPIVMAVLVVLVLVGVVFARSSVEAEAVEPTALPLSPVPTTTPTDTPLPTAVPTATPLPATVTPAYPDITSHLAIITAHEEAGRWSDAAAAAEAALLIPALRDEDRRVLTSHVVLSGMRALSSEPFKPLDRAQHQEMVDTYLSLRGRARGANVAIETPLQVATWAYGSSQLQLARVSLEEAMKDGSWDPEINRDLTRRYVDTLFGLGRWYTTAERGSPLFNEGIGWLAASKAVAERYETGQSDAARLLEQFEPKSTFRSPHWTTPVPASTPLLP